MIKAGDTTDDLELSVYSGLLDKNKIKIKVR
jgi:hypothetical protein